MISINRDSLVKQKGNIELPDLSEINLNNLDLTKIVDILLEIYLKETNQEKYD
mgnify:CR=1 FL=1